MDVWRYSDWWGLGAELRNSQRHIWHWRDWIVESLNADIGYDEMVRQMLAADELYPADIEKLRATGYLARSYFLFNRTTWMDEVVEHAAKAFLGLTMNCAKCHDHKFDPISHEDYYAFRAFFEPYQVRTDVIAGQPDVGADGVPRVFDCNLQAPTYLHERGNEAQPRMDAPLTPGLPRVFAQALPGGELKIEPINLPPAAYQPGLQPWVIENELRAAEQRIAAARTALGEARTALAAAEQAAIQKTPVSIDKPQAAETPAAASATQTPAAGDDGSVAVTAAAATAIAVAKAQAAVAETTLAAAALQPTWLRARSAADRALAVEPPASDAESLKQAAATVESKVRLANAEESLARAELALLQAAADQKAGPQAKRDAALAAVAAARKHAESPDGDYTQLAGAVKARESNVETDESYRRAFPRTSTGRRSALSRWITDRQNPLAARVAANHLWTRHFGRPLVATVADFGRKGSPPTHPALLDWLAVELMDRGWSMKHLHRLMVTSATYRMSSSEAGAEANVAADGDNNHYWRMNSQRMEAQIVRDCLLAMTGELDLTLGGPSIPIADAASRRRSLYFVHSSNDQQKFLGTFDDAGVRECYRRSESIVPQQALALSNSKLAIEAASKLADRIAAEVAAAGKPIAGEAFVAAAFETILATSPTPAELAECERTLAALNQSRGSQTPDDVARRARGTLVHALLNHNDFITVR